MIQLYHCDCQKCKVSSALSLQNYRFDLYLAILLDPNNS